MKINVTDEGRIEGYLSTSEYAESIGVTAGNVRIMIERGLITPLQIRAGTGKNQCFNFIKEGTPKPTKSRKENK